MDNDRDALLIEIRDLLAQHVQTHGDWVAHLRRQEGNVNETLDSMSRLERANDSLQRRVLLLGAAVIICVGLIAIGALLGRPN